MRLRRFDPRRRRRRLRRREFDRRRGRRRRFRRRSRRRLGRRWRAHGNGGRRFLDGRRRFGRRRFDDRRRGRLNVLGRRRQNGRRRRGRGFRRLRRLGRRGLGLDVDDHFPRRLGPLRRESRAGMRAPPHGARRPTQWRPGAARRDENPAARRCARSAPRRSWPWLRLRRGSGAAAARDDGDAGEAGRRQVVHHRDDVAVGGLPVAAQLDDAVGAGRACP